MLRERGAGERLRWGLRVVLMRWTRAALLGDEVRFGRASQMTMRRIRRSIVPFCAVMMTEARALDWLTDLVFGMLRPASSRP